MATHLNTYICGLDTKLLQFSLSSVDLFAIPDFAAGAMENWGLVTYHETALLYNPDSLPLKSKQWVAIRSSQLAHQWFGNLVTMKWWSDLWLNEGFVSFVEYIGAEHADPSVNMVSVTCIVSSYMRTYVLPYSRENVEEHFAISCSNKLFTVLILHFAC